MRLIVRWLTTILINAVALFAVSHLFQSFYIESFETAIFAGLILSIFNLLVKPILILFTLPLTILTLGLFLFVINAFILVLTQSVMGDVFIIDGFGIALLAAVLIAIINTVLNKLFDIK